MSNLNTKQVIVVRNDLRSKLRHGKLGAQIAHASMASFLQGMEIEQLPYSQIHTLKLDLDKSRHEWITGSFTKVVLKCKDEEELLELYERCSRNSKIPCSLITDSGRTVFKEPTVTCLGIGPLPESILNPIIGHLSLY